MGDIIRAVPVPGAKQFGDGLDDVNRRAKEALPPYKHIEEGASDVVRKGFNELNGEVDGPVLAQWINASRNNVINSGVSPIPPQIYQGLVGFFHPYVLNRVRYRSGWGNELALPSLAFHYGDAAAITLGPDIVMFRDENEAQNNLSLWAHELTHALQYERWGTLDFAKRYVKDHTGVEREAIDNAARFDIWYSQRLSTSNQSNYPPPAIPVWNPNYTGNYCLLENGVRVGPGNPNVLGAPCNVMTPQGIIFGRIVP